MYLKIVLKLIGTIVEFLAKSFVIAVGPSVILIRYTNIFPPFFLDWHLKVICRYLIGMWF